MVRNRILAIAAFSASMLSAANALPQDRSKDILEHYQTFGPHDQDGDRLGKVQAVYVYNCPKTEPCNVYVHVEKKSNKCKFSLKTGKDSGSDSFFYIDKTNGVYAITWELVTTGFEFDNGGINFLDAKDAENIEITRTKITKKLNKLEITKKPLFLYDVNVKDCGKPWGPGIINRG